MGMIYDRKFFKAMARAGIPDKWQGTALAEAVSRSTSLRSIGCEVKFPFTLKKELHQCCLRAAAGFTTGKRKLSRWSNGFLISSELQVYFCSFRQLCCSPPWES